MTTNDKSVNIRCIPWKALYEIDDVERKWSQRYKPVSVSAIGSGDRFEEQVTAVHAIRALIFSLVRRATGSNDMTSTADALAWLE